MGFPGKITANSAPITLAILMLNLGSIRKIILISKFGFL
jgi:hypothetical protein